MQQYNIAILGCGAIFNRHISAIAANQSNYTLCGIFDPIEELKNKYSKDLKVRAYATEEDVYTDSNINCIAILSPNNLHFDQATRAIQHKKYVILEKPATFNVDDLTKIENLAKANGVEVFCILQVRLNPAVIIAKMAIEQGILGNIRGVSLIQRWQRPLDYFSGWRGSMETGGGILREFAIHYLDAMQFVLNQRPKVAGASFFNTKFKNTDVADTIYALFDFNSFGGSMEISIASEPKNLECTLSIMCDNGFVKLGGKSLDEIIICDFLDESLADKFERIRVEVLKQEVATLANLGASPYHPELYRKIILEPEKFTLRQTHNVIELIEQVYSYAKH